MLLLQDEDDVLQQDTQGMARDESYLRKHLRAFELIVANKGKHGNQGFAKEYKTITAGNGEVCANPMRPAPPSPCFVQSPIWPPTAGSWLRARPTAGRQGRVHGGRRTRCMRASTGTATFSRTITRGCL